MLASNGRCERLIRTLKVRLCSCRSADLASDRSAAAAADAHDSIRSAQTTTATTSRLINCVPLRAPKRPKRLHSSARQAAAVVVCRPPLDDADREDCFGRRLAYWLSRGARAGKRRRRRRRRSSGQFRVPLSGVVRIISEAQFITRSASARGMQTSRAEPSRSAAQILRRPAPHSIIARALL